MTNPVADGASCEVERGEINDMTAWKPSQSLTLAEHTTSRVGGKAKKLIVAETTDDLVAAVSQCDEAGEKLLIISGGSNMLVADDGFDGTAVQVATTGISFTQSDCGGALVRVAAGEVWDDFVQLAIARGWVGIEALSGIPGLVGATPIQNVGAYGQEVAATIARVRTWDRVTKQFHTFTYDQCGFGYRDSIFKRSLGEMGQDSVTGRYVIVEVWYQFRLGSDSTPIAYKQLAEKLSVQVGDRVPAARLREAVLELRASKGMVLDANDHDTWSTGSFFTNPILEPDVAADLPAEAPQFAQLDGRVKTSAAWLIEHCGLSRGWPGTGQARLSTKHVLALTNRGQASAAEMISLARQVRNRVAERYQIDLVAEPVLVGLGL